MSKQAPSLPESSSTMSSVSLSRGAPARPTPHRPVVSLALVLFIPALWLVLDGNLSVQTALVRFIGALLVSWVAARLVTATVSSYTRSAEPAEPAEPAGAAGTVGSASAGGVGTGGTGGATGAVGLAGLNGVPDVAGSTGPAAGSNPSSE
jgi:hypothetical protein